MKLTKEQENDLEANNIGAAMIPPDNYDEIVTERMKKP